MIQWLMSFFIIKFFVCTKKKIINFENLSKNLFNEYDNNFIINSEKKKIENIKCENNNSIIFNSSKKNEDLLINFFSINCDIQVKIYNENNIIENHKNNTFSIKIPYNLSRNIEIHVRPEVSLKDGINKNKHNINFPLIINIDNNENKLNVNENSRTEFYFNSEINNNKLSYKKNLKKSNLENLVTLLFLSDEKSKFKIEFIEGNNSIILNSTKILLYYNFLYSKIKNNKLNIFITYINKEEPVLLESKENKNNSIKPLNNNSLNKEFIYSRNSYQYYYMKVFKGEEGEIMLHNKRINGKLLGIIKPNNSSYNDESEYLKEEDISNNKSNLKFNKNIQKLSFNSSQTSDCQEGCYIFITYYHNSTKEDNNIIGYNFTLLVRVWNEEDFSSEIIDIPFNEYIFGCFDENSIKFHHYSIEVPEDTKQIIIQTEGNYYEGFIGGGKRKLNTLRITNKTRNLNIENKRMVITFNKSELGEIISEKNLSLSFRSKNFFNNIFSFYYFRILYQRENESYLIYPLDSNIGSLCQPEKEGEGNFSCYFLLKNNNNEFSHRHYITTSNQKEKNTFLITKNYKNGNISKEEKINNYFYEGNYNNDLESVLFKFIFKDKEPKIILSIFSNNESEIYPQIYSSQIFKFDIGNYTLNFNLNNNFLFVFNYVDGSGQATLDNNINIPKLEANGNFRGKPISIYISDKKQINFECKNKLVFYLDFDYKKKSNDIKEIIYGESINEVLIGTHFPVYYYMKYSKQKNIDINFRIIKFREIEIINFTIDGYLLNKSMIETKINGNYLDLNEIQKEAHIEGKYDPYFKIGLLNINEAKINSSQNLIKNLDLQDLYILISIGGIKFTEKSDVSIEIVTMSKINNFYLLPINEYIIGEYNSYDKEKNYLIEANGKEEDQIMIEFSPNNEGIKLQITHEKDLSKDISLNCFENTIEGKQKYRIDDSNERINLNIIIPENLTDANYILRYFFTKKEDEFEFQFNQSFEKTIFEIKENFANISLKFKKINILKNGQPQNKTNFNGTIYKIFGFLFIDENNNKKFLNTSAFIPYEIPYKAKDLIFYNENETFTLNFTNISKTNSKFYLKIEANIMFGDFLFNREFLVYTLPIDLTNDFKKRYKKFLNKLEIIILCLGIVIILIIILLIVIYLKMKKKNKNLKEKVLSISFTSGKTDNDILEENSHHSKKDDDYENTFI